MSEQEPVRYRVEVSTLRYDVHKGPYFHEDEVLERRASLLKALEADNVWLDCPGGMWVVIPVAQIAHIAIVPESQGGPEGAVREVLRIVSEWVYSGQEGRDSLVRSLEDAGYPLSGEALQADGGWRSQGRCSSCGSEDVMYRNVYGHDLCGPCGED